MEIDFPDSRKISQTILFLSDYWDVRSRYENTVASGFPIRFDNLLSHKIKGIKIAIFEIHGNSSVRQNEISVIALLSKSLLGIDHVLMMSGRLSLRERKMLSDFSLPYFSKIGIQDKSGNITWLGHKPNNAGNARRNKEELIKEIIRMTQERECRVTELVYRCNLNYARTIEILDELMKKNYISMSYEDGHRKFRATMDGREYLKRMQSAGP